MQNCFVPTKREKHGDVRFTRECWFGYSDRSLALGVKMLGGGSYGLSDLSSTSVLCVFIARIQFCYRSRPPRLTLPCLGYSPLVTHHLQLQGEAAADSSELRKEINILKSCQSPYIVAYKGSYFKDGKLWIAMEYCGAGSLSDLMAICDMTLSEAQIAAIMKQSLRGLEYLHAHKKIHRDIKSGNILLTWEGECKLADFGVSAELSNTLARRVTMIGTPYFMAPEVLEGKQYDAKADIWSLAITAYELAVGQPPHSNIHPLRAIFVIPTAPPPTLPDPETWSEEFKDFLAKCLQMNPADRPTASQLLQHPFVRDVNETAEVKRLLALCEETLERFREAEAKDQQANGLGLPSEGETADVVVSGTVVINPGAAAAGNPEQSAMATMIPGTVVIKKPEPQPEAAGTIVIQKPQQQRHETHMGTIRVKKNTKPAVSEDAFSTIVVQPTATANASTQSAKSDVSVTDILNKHKLSLQAFDGLHKVIAGLQNDRSRPSVEQAVRDVTAMLQADMKSLNAYYNAILVQLQNL